MGMPIFPWNAQSSKQLRKTFPEMLCTYNIIQSITVPWQCWSAGRRCTAWPCCSSACLCSWPAPGGATGPQRSARRSGNERSRAGSHRRRLLHSTRPLLDGGRAREAGGSIDESEGLGRRKNVNCGLLTEIPQGTALYALQICRLRPLYHPLSLLLCPLLWPQHTNINKALL